MTRSDRKAAAIPALFLMVVVFHVGRGCPSLRWTSVAVGVILPRAVSLSCCAVTSWTSAEQLAYPISMWPRPGL